MKAMCPGCDNIIEKSNINLKTCNVYCEKCNSTHTMSEAFDHYALKKKELMRKKLDNILENPPKRTYINEGPEKIVIGTSTRSLLNLFILLIAFLLSGAVFSFSYGHLFTFVNYIRNTGDFLTNPQTYLSLLFVLLCVPPIIGSVLILICIPIAINGKVEIVIGKESYIFTGIGKIGLKKKFDWDSVKRIYMHTFKVSTERMQPSGPKPKDTYHQIIIECKGNEKVKFGKYLRGGYFYELHYLLAALQYYHKQKLKTC